VTGFRLLKAQDEVAAVADEKTQAEERVHATRAELAHAETPADVNRVRLKAEALRTMLAKAVEAGAPHIAEAARDAQVLSLEAACALGERALPADSPEEADARKSAKSKGAPLTVPKLDAKRVRAVAAVSGAKRVIVRRYALVALARRIREDDFDDEVFRALEAGKPIPTHRLAAMGKGPVKPRKKIDSAGEDQVAVRMNASLLEALDGARGKEPRAKWLRRLVDDVLGREPVPSAVHLVMRALDALHRANASPKVTRAVRDLEGALERLEGTA
jgi:hypothetical protein